MSKVFQHDSIFGGLNLFKRRDKTFLLATGERTPYPIIKSNVTFVDCFWNMNKADFGMIFVSFIFGIFLITYKWNFRISSFKIYYEIAFLCHSKF